MLKSQNAAKPPNKPRLEQGGDMVAKWIVHGTLNALVMGLNLSASS